LQMELEKEFSAWYEHITLLYSSASPEILRQITDLHDRLIDLIRKNNGWNVPDSIQAAKDLFHKEAQNVDELLSIFEEKICPEVIIVPDTNSLIARPDFMTYASIARQEKFTIVLVPTVLEELDKLKTHYRDQEFRNKVDSVIARIKGIRNQGFVQNGVTVNKSITLKMIAPEPNFSNTLGWLQKDNFDDRIIASVLEIQRNYPTSIVILTTSDINLQNKAEMANLPYEETPKIR
jgi:hypothetical protein